MRVVCDLCHQFHDKETSWWIERGDTYRFYNPETKDIRINMKEPEKLWFCTHYHRNQYLFGT